MSENLSEKSPPDLPEFVKVGEFDTRPGLAVQFELARRLVDLIGKTNIQPRTLYPLIEAIDIAFPNNQPDQRLQEMLIRNTTGRLVALIALVASDGNRERAESLLGANPTQIGSLEMYDRNDLTLAETAQKMLHPNSTS